MTSPTVRALADADRDAVTTVITAAFADEGPAVATLWADVVARGLVRAELVATDGSGQVVGHVGVSHAWLDARSELLDIVVLSPLSVAPDQQKNGIGRSLLDAAIKAAEQLGAPLIVLEGDPGYYGRLGWQPASSYGITGPTKRIPPPAFQCVALSAYEPWMTGQVVYREVWWEHDSTGLRDPMLAQIEMSDQAS